MEYRLEIERPGTRVHGYYRVGENKVLTPGKWYVLVIV
jgi:hypothetical protein